MGYALARMAMLRGADVTLVTGETSLTRLRLSILSASKAHTTSLRQSPPGVRNRTLSSRRQPSLTTVRQSFLMKRSRNPTAIRAWRWSALRDTLSYLGAHKRPGQLLCGFAMETSQLEERARGKLERKNLDLIAANNLKVAGAGFGTDTNVITLIDKQQTRHRSR